VGYVDPGENHSGPTAAAPDLASVPSSAMPTQVSLANTFPDEIVRFVEPYLSDWPHHKPLR
jgi:hypothetical protein